MPRNNWTREELILTFNLYLKIPFGKFHHGNKEVNELAGLINRTPSAVAMRLSNFASVDPFHQNRGISGLRGGIAQVQPIWDEFSENKEDLIFESEKILAQIQKTTVEIKFNNILKDVENLTGETKIREVKTRINQNVFRQIVLANYSSTCAITGIDIPELLIASHIVPWAVNEKERLNPENGICFSPLYDKAFDKGLIGIDIDYKIVLSSEIKGRTTKDFYYDYFGKIEGKPIRLPQKYLPKREFLEWHLTSYF